MTTFHENKNEIRLCSLLCLYSLSLQKDYVLNNLSGYLKMYNGSKIHILHCEHFKFWFVGWAFCFLDKAKVRTVLVLATNHKQRKGLVCSFGGS